jgi:predicted nucleic acid-binding protein
VSLFVLDASYTMTWCFPDRATPNTDEKLERLEAALDSAIVPAIWPIEVANALGKGVVRRKLTENQAQEIWNALRLLPIRESRRLRDVPRLLGLAVRHNISVYDACYLEEARLVQAPLATNDHGLRDAAELYGVAVLMP